MHADDGARSQVDYFYGHVVLTLAMVETPHEKMYLAVDPPQKSESETPLLSEKTEGKVQPPPQAELLLVKRPLVISSIFKAARHLRAQVGRGFKVRGFGLAMLSHLLVAIFRESLHRGLFRTRCYFSMPCASFVANVLVTGLMLTWTHVVISKPSSKWWFSRVPSFRYILRVAPATAIWALAQELTVGLPAVLAKNLLDSPQAGLVASPRSTGPVLAVTLLAIVAVAVATFVLIYIPAVVTLARVQASMLPETDEAIVPFDRTFDGKVVATADGGSGRLGLLDAWRTFGWVSRRNLLKLLVQVFAFEMTIILVFSVIIAAQVLIIVEPTHDQWLVVAKAYMNGNA